MATYDELARLIRRGLTAEEIIERLGVEPARLRRMLKGKRLARRLALIEEVALRVAAHRTAGRVAEMTERLVELAYSDKSETARKACVALLGEGIRIMEADSPRPAGANTTPATHRLGVGEDQEDPNKHHKTLARL